MGRTCRVGSRCRPSPEVPSDGAADARFPTFGLLLRMPPQRGRLLFMSPESKKTQFREATLGRVHIRSVRLILYFLSLVVLVGGIGVAIFWPFHSVPCTISNEGHCANPELGHRILIGVATALVAFVLYAMSRHGEKTPFLSARDRD